MSFDRLIEKIDAMQNPTVAGLDPKLEYITDDIKKRAFEQFGGGLDGAAAAVLEWGKGMIDALCDIVPAVKPQLAYYERFGWQGVKCLTETIEYAKEKGMFVIADGKRNDIGSTMEAYSDAYLGNIEIPDGVIEPFGADALTVNGYLGADGINQPLKLCDKYDKGIFVLVKTSNPSSGQLQDKLLENGNSVSVEMGNLCRELGEESRKASKYGYSAIGAVVGATYPEQLTALRKEFPGMFFLVPGYGAQGGGASDIIGAFDENGRGAIVNSSRAIICAWKKRPDVDWQTAAREEALSMKKAINEALGR
ncbi:MAG: orotidine-5'-phosphate decarboxylase [Ruminococcaceae bacterium]|nr:orotidine-5'-phosphate decarboxylase [Oscillospiraceae bacterium]